MGSRKTKSIEPFVLRPGITNPELWNPVRPPEAEWKRIRRVVLERDDYTCHGCGHRAFKYMNIHHLDDSAENVPEKLATVCVACHAVLHAGRSAVLGVIEIWESALSQTEIVQRTREGVKEGRSLAQINEGFDLLPGYYPPEHSGIYANELVRQMGKAPRSSLPEPLSAIFVSLNRWQLE